MTEFKEGSEMPRDAKPFWESAADFYWKHLMIRCGSPACSLRLNLQPAVLARFRGIHFNHRWYHDIACLQEALLAQLKRQLLPTGARSHRPHRIPIGLLLLKRGAITPEELRDGLRLQRTAGTGKLGYWLRQVTALDEDEICAALGQQWGCPVFPLDRQTAPPVTRNAPPYLLLAAAKAVPAFATHDGRQWHIAFSDRIDHTLLYALEEILECRTLACVARESAVNEALELFQKHTSASENCFDSVRDPGEMAATICSYAAQMDARQVKTVRAAGYLWAAFFQKGARRDLLFRLPPEALPSPLELLAGQGKAIPTLADMRKDGVRDA
jgi:hypothetical protein